MKKYLLLILYILVLSCSSDDDGIDFYAYEFFENSNLSITELDGSYMKYGTISDGEKVVFKYTFIASDEEQIADDEYAEFIHFEIDSKLDSFVIEGEALSISKAVFSKSCFCFFSDNEEKNVNPTGSIFGEKISADKWRVNVDVTFYGDDIREFEAIFVLK